MAIETNWYCVEIYDKTEDKFVPLLHVSSEAAGYRTIEKRMGEYEHIRKLGYDVPKIEHFRVVKT